MHNGSGNTIRRLSGKWLLATDPGNVGAEEGWYRTGPTADAVDAPVPGVLHQVYPYYHGIVWYWHEFAGEPDTFASAGDRCLLKFGAVDYAAKIWLNGVPLGEHEGGETPFELDATAALNAPGRNMLAVRVLNPTSERIDGIVIGETPHRNKVPANERFTPGSSFNHGGIMMPVELERVPALYVRDVFAAPDPDTGEVEIRLEAHNFGGVAVEATLELTVAQARAGSTLLAERTRLTLEPGANAVTRRLTVSQPQAWSPEEPNLYRLNARLQAAVPANGAEGGSANGAENGEEGGPENGAEGGGCSERSVGFGFRRFEVKGGFFYLNGKRVFVRSSHTGNHYPVGLQYPVQREFLFKDLIYAKASGFNMVRFIAGTAYPEQLSFCDEIGLMVYEESFASWLLADSPHMGERFDNAVLEMVRRDRSHPSIVAWGLLNETFDGPVFRRAVACLPKLRELDPTRLVLLGSGRWDDQNGIGSVSNPGSGEWEHVWGAEAPGPLKEMKQAEWYNDILGYVARAGDAHLYPEMPQTADTTRKIRALGRDDKPVFVSEYGIGSLLDVVRGARLFEQTGYADVSLADADLFRSMAERFLADWSKFGMERTYPAAEYLFRESQKQHAVQRRLQFDILRANPQVCGYNLTGMLDHAITGEGLWTYWREWKPDIVDTLADGWSPLRWCLFVEAEHAYAGRPVEFEAVLANEDVLRPGEYSATLRIDSPHGTVWERRVSFTLPEGRGDAPPPLAVPVYKGTFVPDRGSGVHEFSAILDRGGAPAGVSKTFFVSDPADLPLPDRGRDKVTAWGVEEPVREWLRDRGYTVADFAQGDPAVGGLLLVGELTPEQTTSADWTRLLAAVSSGAAAIFLSPTVFAAGEGAIERLPLEIKGSCDYLKDWLYHKECVAKPHPLFAGLPGKGIMDWRYYGDVIAKYVFDGQQPAADTAAAAFATGYTNKGGYKSGALFAAYPLGKGMFCLNTLRVLENVGKHPAADRLLLNMIGYAAAGAGSAQKTSAQET